MQPTSRLYHALYKFLSQPELSWADNRHLQTLCWMMVGMIQSQNVHLNGFGVYVLSRAQFAQSHQRRFRRWLSNRRVDAMATHHVVMRQALSQWVKGRLYLSLDTTMVWNCFCIVWVGVVFRGRTIPVAWQVVPQSSSTVRLWTVQRVLRQAQRVLPTGAEVVLLADRGFADGKLMKYLKETLHWHFRIRIKRSFYFEHQGQWRSVRDIKLARGQAWFAQNVRLGKTNPYGTVHLAFAQDAQSGEFWAVVSDEATTLQTFAQYRLRFTVEESFLDLKSNGFNLEASGLRDKRALSQLCGAIALTMLFLVIQGVQVVASGKRRQVDPHWRRGMSYLKLGWNWVRLAMTQQWPIQVYWFLSRATDPEPAMASRKQHERSLKREFTVLHRFPAS